MTGKELQQRIRRAGVTQKELAQKMGMSPTQWTTYFKQRSVTSEVIEQVACHLGMTIAQFYGIPVPPASGGASPSASGGVPSSASGGVSSSPAFGGDLSSLFCTDPQAARLLDIIQARDRQLDKAQQQIDRLLALLQSMQPAVAPPGAAALSEPETRQ